MEKGVERGREKEPKWLEMSRESGSKGVERSWGKGRKGSGQGVERGWEKGLATTSAPVVSILLKSAAAETHEKTLGLPRTPSWHTQLD